VVSDHRSLRCDCFLNLVAGFPAAPCRLQNAYFTESVYKFPLKFLGA
jgi:hypothetical protein